MLGVAVSHSMRGASLGSTAMVNEHSELLPARSVAVQTTVVSPMVKAAPDGGLQRSVSPSVAASDTTGEKYAIAVHSPGFVLSVWSGGHRISGGRINDSHNSVASSFI